MNFAPTYLLGRFFYRIYDFLHHWYFDGSRAFFHRFVAVLEVFERIFAVGMTARFFFHPLYGDYTLVGRILGFIFRSCRIAIGLFVYIILLAIFLFLYAIWLSFPAILVFYAVLNFVKPSSLPVL